MVKWWYLRFKKWVNLGSGSTPFRVAFEAVLIKGGQACLMMSCAPLGPADAAEWVQPCEGDLYPALLPQEIIFTLYSSLDYPHHSWPHISLHLDWPLKMCVLWFRYYPSTRHFLRWTRYSFPYFKWSYRIVLFYWLTAGCQQNVLRFSAPSTVP